MSLRTLAIAVILLVAGGAWHFVNQGEFVCVHDTLDKSVGYSQTIAALDGIVDLGIKFSTTLTGIGAAVLLGWREGSTLGARTRLVLLISSSLFVQSALYGVWWRLGIGEAWLNECLNLVTEDVLQLRFTAHIYFFMSGLLSIAILTVMAPVKQHRKRRSWRGPK